MSFHSGNEDAGANHERILASQESTANPSWRQDDAPTGSKPDLDDAGSRVDEAPPARDRDTLIAILEATPRELAHIIEGESRERLVKPASDGDWGIVEILPHIGDWEEVAAFWTKRILNEDTPALEAVDDSLWAIEHDYAREDPFEALERFAQMRYALVQVLEGLDDEDWRRTGIHAVRGEMTLHQFVDRMCDHDARYLAQARDALT